MSQSLFRYYIIIKAIMLLIKQGGGARGPELAIKKLSKPNPNSTQINSKQLYVTRVEVRHRSHVFHHSTPPTYHNLFGHL